jgi:hypothetical protein
MPLGLALSEKQTLQVNEKIEKPKKQMEGLESRVVLRSQTLYPRASAPEQFQQALSRHVTEDLSCPAHFRVLP